MSFSVHGRALLPHLRTVVVVAVVTAGVGSAVAAPAQAQQRPGSDFYGLNAQPLVKLGFIGADGWAPYLSQVARGGLLRARVDALWAWAEPAAPTGGVHTYTWDPPSRPTQSLDRIARELAVQGIRMVPVLASPPRWAAGSDTRLDPSRYGDFAAFSAAYAARYGTGGSFWRENPGLPALPTQQYEVWTEANSANFWAGRAVVTEYIPALRAVRAAVRGADPAAQVLASIGWEGADGYVRQLYALGARDAFDGIAYHPYAPHGPAIIALVTRMRATLRAVGDPGLPIDVTETGQPISFTRPPGPRAGEGTVSDAARAATQSLAGDALARSDCGIGSFLLYTVVGSETGLEPGGEGSMGVLHRADAQPNATGRALFAASQRWRAAPRGGLVLCGGGTTQPGALLPLALTLDHRKPTCVDGLTTYEGNPIEAAMLTLRTADGRVAKHEIDAFGKGEVCIPDGPPVYAFDVQAEIENVAASPTYRCPVSSGPCVVVAASTESAPTPPSAAACRWVARVRVVRARGATARAEAGVRCAPRAAKLRFAVAAQRRGRGKARFVRAITLTEAATTRTFTLPARLAKADRLVATHAATSTTPRLAARVGTLGGAQAGGEEGCTWRVQIRVLRRSGVRTRLRARVRCVAAVARKLSFSVSVRRRGATTTSPVGRVTLSDTAGALKAFTVKARLRRGDRLLMQRGADAAAGIPRIATAAQVGARAAAR